MHFHHFLFYPAPVCPIIFLEFAQNPMLLKEKHSILKCFYKFTEFKKLIKDVYNFEILIIVEYPIIVYCYVIILPICCVCILMVQRCYVIMLPICCVCILLFVNYSPFWVHAPSNRITLGCWTSFSKLNSDHNACCSTPEAQSKNLKKNID